MPRHTRLTLKEEAMIIRLYKMGSTPKQIAGVYECSEEQIRRRLTSAGVRKKMPRGKRSVMVGEGE